MTASVLGKRNPGTAGDTLGFAEHYGWVAMAGPPYAAFDVDVSGGRLHVARWGSGHAVAVAAHGITATHRSFRGLAEQLGGEVTLLAPDLRGRGRSNGIAGPFSMAAHADDLVDVLDHAGVEQATVVGHSMGAFVAVVTAHRHPGRVSRLVLIDGGLPLDLGSMAGQPIDSIVAAIIGPALERLRLTFPSVDAYLDYWRRHPAFATDWNAWIEDVCTYDLEGDVAGDPPELRSGSAKRQCWPTPRPSSSRTTSPAASKNSATQLFSCAPRPGSWASHQACTPTAGSPRGRGGCRRSVTCWYPTSTTTRSCSASVAPQPSPQSCETSSACEHDGVVIAIATAGRPDRDGLAALPSGRAAVQAGAMSKTIVGSLPISTLASDSVLRVDVTADLWSVASALAAADVGILVVGQGDVVEGVVSERDVVRALAAHRGAGDTTAGDIANRDLVWCDVHADVADVAEEMMEHYVRHVLVERRGRLVGIVSARDLLGAYASGDASADDDEE